MGQTVFASSQDQRNDDIADMPSSVLSKKTERKQKKEKAAARLSNYSVLDLSNLNVKNIPKCMVTLLEDAIKNAESEKPLLVKEITLFGNRFTELPVDLLTRLHDAGLLKELKVLDLSFNRFEGEFPEQVGKLLENVQRFMILGNRITSLPPSLEHSTQLVYLDLRENMINVDTVRVTEWKSLKCVRMTNCGLNRIPVGLLALPSLTQLDLSHNQIVSLESESYSLPELTELNMLDNCLESLPEELFSNMKSIKVVCVTENRIPKLPDSICECNTLQQLYTSRNRLTGLPNEFGKLVKLTHLDASFNQIKELPLSMSALENLQICDFTSNQLVEIDVSSLASLYELNLSSNKLTYLDIRNTTHLSMLYAGYNAIEEFTLDNASANSLKQLNLSGNRITKIAQETIAQLTQLTVLYLSENELEILPDNICTIPRLRHFNASQNKISELHGNVAFFESKELVSLNLSLNRITMPITISMLSGHREAQLQCNGIPEIDQHTMHNYVCGDKVGYAHTIGPFRPSMEDALVIKSDIVVNTNHVQLYAVFDGHAGSKTSCFAASRLDVIIKQLLQEQSSEHLEIPTAEHIVRKALAKIDEEVKQFTDGSTVAMVMILNEKVCIAANVGDARAVLASRFDDQIKAKRITYDHKPTDRSEADRVYDIGGVIIGGRINGYAVSRAIGDHIARPFITSEPYIESFELKQQDEFIVIACDGVWDVHSDQFTVELVDQVVQREQDYVLFRAAQTVVDTAIANHSRDNISAIIVKLK
jgi:serine/threonine protein phosphatase PrpC/Leucine-rich repeat (LRR) protein